MGTNFYLGKYVYETKYENHIGKRSAAGLYCWDCDETLIIGGKDMIHKGNTGVYDNCPKCGQKKTKETIEESSGGLELGFGDRYNFKRKKGVQTCSSFTWAMGPDNLRDSRKRIIYDEYGNKYTKKEFFKMVKNTCPVQFYHSIGRNFS